MRVSWHWLKELVELKTSPEELARLFTMAGVETEIAANPSQCVKGVEVGLIKEVKKHPQADRLWVCKVITGGDRVLTLVSGAPNLREGQKVPVALDGAVLAGGRRIEKTVFRGIESAGMLCSPDELGLDADKMSAEEKEGIYILPADVPLGEDVTKLLGLDDYILELDLTPNRSDCLSMFNVAREAAALTGGELTLPFVEASKPGGEAATLTSVTIEDADLCKRYVARVIRDIKVARSPLWLRHRLLAAGVRPINNIVDITNYVMLETGQPLHAFDYDKLAENRIVVRRAARSEELITLDGQKRSLSPNMLVIADAAKPVGIAGVMGGLETEVTTETKTVLLEAAFFNGPSIRRTSQALGLRSEASQRFEKEVDPDRVALAADRALQLMFELGAGIPVDGHVDCCPAMQERVPIVLRLSRINQILGTSLDGLSVEKILKALQIRIIQRNEQSWTLLAPSYRRDLEREIDLIEEVARLYGYDKIPTTLPLGPTTQGSRTREQRLRRQINALLSSLGLYQVITFSFINPRHFEFLRLPDKHPLRETVTVANPLSEEQGVMRTTLLPGLLDVVKKNLNKRNKDLALYELGKIYLKDGFPKENPLPLEKDFLAAVATGMREKTWAYPAMQYDFFYLKGILENLLSRLGVGAKTAFHPLKEESFLHPGRSAEIEIGGNVMGWLGEIHPLVLENYGIEQKTTAFMLDLTLLLKEAAETTGYEPIPRYPSVTRDLAVIVPEETAAIDISKLIEENGKPWLKRVYLFDLYRGKQISAGFKSLAFALTWQAEDRTLTDEEVNDLHQEILRVLAKEAGAQLRA